MDDIFTAWLLALKLLAMLCRAQVITILTRSSEESTEYTHRKMTPQETIHDIQSEEFKAWEVGHPHNKHTKLWLMVKCTNSSSFNKLLVNCFFLMKKNKKSWIHVSQLDQVERTLNNHKTEVCVHKAEVLFFCSCKHHFEILRTEMWLLLYNISTVHTVQYIIQPPCNFMKRSCSCVWKNSCSPALQQLDLLSACAAVCSEAVQTHLSPPGSG